MKDEDEDENVDNKGRFIEWMKERSETNQRKREKYKDEFRGELIRLQIADVD